MTENLEELVARIAKPLIEAQGLALWGVEILSGGKTKVRVFVDVPESAKTRGASSSGLCMAEQGSATIDQCEEISRQLGLAMDVEDCIPQAWVLEVSSPGFDRRFFALEQLVPYVGDVMEARLSSPAVSPEEEGSSPRLRWRGTLLGVDAEGFTLSPCAIGADGKVCPEGSAPVRLPWAKVRRAARIPVFPKPAKPGKGQGRHISQACRTIAAAGGRHES